MIFLSLGRFGVHFLLRNNLVQSVEAVWHHYPCRSFGRESLYPQKVADKKPQVLWKSVICIQVSVVWWFVCGFHRPRFCMHKFTGVIFDFRLWHECFLKWIGMPRSAPPLTETLLHPTVLFVKRRFGKFCSNFFLCGCFFGSDWLLE